MPDNNHIPDSGKVNAHPKPGNTGPTKADPPVQGQPDPVKTEPPAVEAVPKDESAPTEGKDSSPKEKEHPDKPLPEDKQTAIPGMEAPAGKVVDFSAARDGGAKDKPPEKATAPNERQADGLPHTPPGPPAQGGQIHSR